MDAFWHWMENKQYAFKDNFHQYYLDDLKKDTTFEGVSPTKQMLIGYLREYLCEKDHTLLIHAKFHLMKTNELYSYLEDKIKSL